MSEEQSPPLERAIYPDRADAAGGPGFEVVLTVLVLASGDALLSADGVASEAVPGILRDVAAKHEADLLAGQPATTVEDVTE